MLLRKLSAVAAIGAIGLGGCASNSPQTDWQPVEAARALEVIRADAPKLENARDFTQIQARVKSLTIVPPGAPPLTIYKFDTDRLRGIGGQLHSIYQDRQPIQRLLLSDNARILVRDGCVEFQQPSSKKTTILRYCDRGSKYVRQPITYKDSPLDREADPN